jgi:hypothetical protein
LGRKGSIDFFEQVFGFLAANFMGGIQRGQPFDQLVVHQRFAHFQRVGHAGTVYLGVDVADQIGLEVEVLDQCQRVIGSRFGGVLIEYLDGIVAAEGGIECGAE